MTTAAPFYRNRIGSIDLLRGIVMVIMAIDHTRDFLHNDSVLHDPLDLSTTTPFLYFTRWITHFCAPTFVLLAGVSAYLVGLRKTTKDLSSFLIKRGAWLILVEVAIVSLGITFDPLYHVLILQVIWAIGTSLVVLGFAVRLPFKAIFAIGCAILLLHNLLDYPEAARQGKVGFLWNIFHSGFFVPYSYAPNHIILIVYPLLPWFGIMLMGYCLGKIFEPSVSANRRRKFLLSLGAGMIVLFIVLRWINGYGDPRPWTSQKDGLYTFLSFMNVQKYPPSLMFTCATLGPAVIALALLEGLKNRVTAFFTVFGRVPFFYYVVHFYMIHLITVVVFFVQGFGVKDIISTTPFLFRPPTLGYSIGGVYLFWAVLILVLYPICKWYNEYKSVHAQWWLSYV